MSLSRAFTTRKGQGALKLSDTSFPQRSNTTKSPSSQQLRNKISSPVQLVHTTNMLSYNAPDLPRPALKGFPTRSPSSSTSKSEDDSDTLNTLDSTPPTSPDVAPGERYPSPVPNHLSTYFTTTSMKSSPPMKPLPTPVLPEAPVIPKRAPSHTKKASMDNTLNRKQSMSRMSKSSDNSLSSKPSMTFSRASSTSTNASHLSTHSRKASAPPRPPPLSPLPPTPAAAAGAAVPRESHPFGQELKQVTELVEEMNFKSKVRVMDEDERYIRSKGLVKFTVDDYLSLVEDLAHNFYPDTTHIRVAGPMWI